MVAITLEPLIPMSTVLEDSSELHIHGLRIYVLTE